MTIISKIELKEIIHTLRWALFSLGIGQLAFVLFGVSVYVMVNILIGILSVLYIARLDHKDSLTTVSRTTLSVSLLLIVLTIAYNYVVLIDVSRQLLIFDFVGVMAFCIAAHITGLFLKGKHVTE